MNAREELKAFIIQNTYSHDMPFRLLPEGEEWGSGPRPDLDISDAEYPAVVDRQLDAFRAEVLREAAEKIREAPEPEGLHDRPIAYVHGWCDGADHAADLIIP